jgi:organic radical activating enzyme
MNNGELPGLYVHIPFCKTKCPYCDFYSITDSASTNTFLDAVISEAGLYGDIFREFDSLYFGGGTPSFIDDKGFARLVSGLQALFVFSPQTEITVEMNPDDVTKEKLSLYKSHLALTESVWGFSHSTIRNLFFCKEDIRQLERERQFTLYNQRGLLISASTLSIVCRDKVRSIG